jgi:hypothetical protein
LPEEVDRVPLYLEGLLPCLTIGVHGTKAAFARVAVRWNGWLNAIRLRRIERAR